MVLYYKKYLVKILLLEYLTKKKEVEVPFGWLVKQLFVCVYVS